MRALSFYPSTRSRKVAFYQGQQKSYKTYFTITKTMAKMKEATPSTKMISPVHLLLFLKQDCAFWIWLSPISIMKLPIRIPTVKYSSASIIPFSDFLEESRKMRKGVSRVTSRQLSKEMLRGSELLAISMILGVCGIQVDSLQLTVRKAVPKITMVVVNDLSEKVGNPKMPQFQRPQTAICDPRPTSTPATINLSVEIFFRQLSSSQGQKLVKCS